MGSRRTQSKTSCCRRLCQFAFCLAILGIAGGLGLYFGLLDEEDIPDGWQIPDDLKEDLKDLPDSLRDHIPDIRIFNGEDPFGRNQQNPDEANKWKNDGVGLELELWNAMDPIWQPYFDISVQEWDVPVAEGSPDTLTLPTKSVPIESECTAVNGIMKVCNGNYGVTDWKGINKVLLQNGWIIASMARMNDEFFGANDDAKRQYTVCHEIGHGFGLPHTDESFWNRDLGNCLDYTTRYNGNKSPDDTNYDFLNALYGTVGGVPPTEQEEEGTGDRALLRRGRSQGLFSELPETRRRELHNQLNELDRIVDASTARPHHWRRLHESTEAAAYEVDLGDSYTVQLHLLREY